MIPKTALAVWFATVPKCPPAWLEGLSASTGGLLGEVDEVEEVWDGLPAGSAAVAVQANAEAKASEVIRI
jgi:hypothetical protein